ncbi:MAG: group II intron reverse transcriptase/maturase, partial [Alphaproteobacteria bacterium]|nr:group II intron reverse transcriptase/maturase [Alphaproteobacteria bacterium]
MMSDTVNTGFILDMQRKLYRWSAADPDKRFADLFNIVCDRGTLLHAWQRLARNKGSNTPGTDGVTRKAVEGRPDGVAGFLEEIRQDLRRGTYRPQPVRQRLIPKPGKPGKFRPL